VRRTATGSPIDVASVWRVWSPAASHQAPSRRTSTNRASSSKASVLGTQIDRLLVELAERHASVGDVRGLGVFGTIELVRDRATRQPLVPFNASGSETSPMKELVGGPPPAYEIGPERNGPIRMRPAERGRPSGTVHLGWHDALGDGMHAAGWADVALDAPAVLTVNTRS
jgi:hypothetical protein